MAKKRKPAKNTRNTPAKKRTPALVWMLIGLCIGLMAAAFAYIASRPVNEPGQHRAKEEDIAQPQDAQVTKKPTEQAEEKRQFDFYDMLRNYKINVEDDGEEDLAAPVLPSKNANSKSGHYIIQAGSFSNKKDAKRQQARLTLLGLQATIQKANLESGKTAYRVRTKVLKSEQDLARALKQLSSEHIDTIVLPAP